MTTDAVGLRGRGEAGLVALFHRRPDVLAEPVPASLTELAGRLAMPSSMARALRRLNRPALQITEALAALGGRADRAALERLLGSPDPAAVASCIDDLASYALVHRTGDELRLVGELATAFERPLGLGVPVAATLAGRTVEDLKAVARVLGLAVAPRKAEVLAAVTAALSDPSTVRTVVETGPPAARELLRRVADTGEDVDYIDFGYPGRSKDTPASWAFARGLLVRLAWDYRLVMPAEVALAIRGEDYAAPFDPDPPPVARVATPAASVAQAASAAGASIVRLTAALLAEASRAPIQALKKGGIGVREQRRLAKLLTCGDDELALAVDLASFGGLIDTAEGRVAPTDAYDTWLRDEPADRLAHLLRAWWTAFDVPLHPDERIDGRAVRAAVLAEAGREPGTAVVAVAELGRAVAWSVPLALGSGVAVDDVDRAVAATWREADLLGVVGANAVAPAGVALLTGGDLTGAIGDIGGVQHSVRLQADLTAVVAGAPAADLADLLDLAADCEIRATASIWRFSPASIRRALDAGITGDGLRDRLAAAAGTPLPQPLDYVIADVVRRHGAVRAVPLACALVSEDTALLAEIAADRRLHRLGLRALAPTVLASTGSQTDTVAALRAAGYAPASVDAGGNVVVEARTAARIVGPAPAVKAPAPGSRSAAADRDPVAVARALLAAPDNAGRKTSPTVRLVRDIARELSDAEVAVLAYAVDKRQPVTIGYVNQNGNGSVRTIEPVELDGASLYAWCHLRQDERMFNLGRILTVESAQAD